MQVHARRHSAFFLLTIAASRTQLKIASLQPGYIIAAFHHTTICGWELPTTPSPRSIRALSAYSTTGSARTWICSPCASTTASAVTAHQSPRATEQSFHLGNIGPGASGAFFFGLHAYGPKLAFRPTCAVFWRTFRPPAVARKRAVDSDDFA